MTIRERTAELDYGGRFAEVNRAKDRQWDIGTLRITFQNSTRTLVTKLEWADEGTSDYEELDVWCSWTPQKHHRFNPNALDERQKALGAAVLRPGQLRFRNTLRTSYGGRCCMTGFGVWEALEAAHIKPFFGERSDHIQNGLLLRADLHRLFDKNLIGINPQSFQISLSPQLKNDPSYGHLHGKQIKLPSRKEDRPNSVALQHRWEQFRKRAI